MLVHASRVQDHRQNVCSFSLRRLSLFGSNQYSDVVNPSAFALFFAVSAIWKFEIDADALSVHNGHHSFTFGRVGSREFGNTILLVALSIGPILFVERQLKRNILLIF